MRDNSFKLFLLLGLLCPVHSFAQTITLTGPTIDQTILEGDDFATSVLRNRWDFDERRDIGWEENFDPASIAITNGEWTGTKLVESGIGHSAGSLNPLFPGLLHGALSDPLPGDTSRPKLGYLNRIDTGRYTHLAFRMNQDNRSDIHVSWNTDDQQDPLFPNPTNPSIEVFDGYRSVGFDINKQGWQLYSFDLSNPTPYARNFQGTWSGNALAIRFEPSLNSNDGDVTRLDWMRLVDPNSAPQINVTWNASGLGSSEVIVVSIDNDGAGYDGTPIAYFTDGVNPGSFSFPGAILPPGQHYVYVEIYGGSSVGIYGPLAQSGYSARIQVTERPTVHVVSPSRVSGEDYSASVLGDRWDMAQTSDVSNLNTSVYSHDYRNFSSQQFVASNQAQEGGSHFQAITQTDPLANHGNPQVHTQVGATRTIDTARFRYATYRMRADPAVARTVRDKANNHWFSQVMYWNTDLSTQQAGISDDQFVFEGWNTYTVDLWDLARTQGVPWRGFYRVGNFALSPLDPTFPVNFEVDYVLLTGENRPNSANHYQVEFFIDDPDSVNLTARIFYDTNSSGFDGVQVATLSGLNPGMNQYDWDMNGLTPGQPYFVYVEVQDPQGNSHRSYSSVPVIPGEYHSQTKAVVSDYDGDGLSDPGLYRPSNGGFYLDWTSIPGGVRIPWLGGSQFYPISGDFDGDDVTDLGLVWEYFGYIVWYIYKSSDAVVYPRIWGLATDQIAIGDYNGNGSDEIAVFRDGVWFILEEDDKVVVRMWGAPGDIAVPHDYDGDSATDIAIFRPTDGMWWIVNSSTVGGNSASQVVARQFGLPGDIPVPAYWSPDEYADIAVYRPSMGLWFLLDMQINQSVMYQWGLPGDIPVVGDFNGDGEGDLTVYRPSDSTWCHNFRNFHYLFHSWGGLGDRLPQTKAIP